MMESEDMIVLVVVDDDESGKPLEKDNFGNSTCMKVEDIIETAQKHGQYIDMKTEPEDYEECDYLDSEFKPEVPIQLIKYFCLSRLNFSSYTALKT